ncbi:MAG: hypothetical protein IJ493_01800 [Clostridia bacterium]|nr:hypothetical protein [Clostridia bacterium]
MPVRWENYDYGQRGLYFITICTKHRMPVLSQIDEAEMDSADTGKFNWKTNIMKFPLCTDDVNVQPSEIGIKVLECWNNIEKLNRNVTIDHYVMMPDHIHGIISIGSQPLLNEVNGRYPYQVAESTEHRVLSGLIKDFKSVTTRYFKRITGMQMSLWQDSFDIKVIFNHEYYIRLYHYMLNNPRKWMLEKQARDVDR